MTSGRPLSARSSAISFIATTVIATASATGLFVLLDPRAQAFWAARLQELVATVRRFLGF